MNRALVATLFTVLATVLAIACSREIVVLDGPCDHDDDDGDGSACSADAGPGSCEGGICDASVTLGAD